MSITTRGMCVHCGVGLPPNIRWCRMCQIDAQNNHGVCRFCHKDIAEFAACWQVRRQMDQVLVKNQIPFMGGCPACRDHNHEDVEMEVVELTVSDTMKYLRMVCPVCQTRCETRYTLYRPPPPARKQDG